MSPYEVTHEKCDGGYVLKATFLSQPEPITGYFHRDQRELVLAIAVELNRIAYKLTTRYVITPSIDRKDYYSTTCVFNGLDNPYGYVIKFDGVIQDIWDRPWKDAQAAKDIAACLMDILSDMIDYEGYRAALMDEIRTEPVLEANV